MKLEHQAGLIECIADDIKRDLEELLKEPLDNYSYGQAMEKINVLKVIKMYWVPNDPKDIKLDFDPDKYLSQIKHKK